MEILEDDKMPDHEFVVLQENGEKVQKAMDQAETTLDTLNTKMNKLFRKPHSRKVSTKRQESKYRKNKHLRESSEVLSLEGTQRGDSMTHIAISQNTEKYGQLKSLPMGGLYG